jgi:hypothetical protein
MKPISLGEYWGKVPYCFLAAETPAEGTLAISLLTVTILNSPLLSSTYLLHKFDL